MLLLIPIVFLAIILFYLISMTMTTNKGCRRRRRKQKECFVEYNEPTATGQIMLTDGVGNLSTFNVGTGKTLVSDGNGNITTINTGLFNNTITANAGISGTTGTFSGQLRANGGLTGTSGTFTGQLTANGGLTTNGAFTGTTGTFTSQLAANGGFTGTTGTFTSILNANGGISGSTANLTGNLSVGGVSSNLNFTKSAPKITASGSVGPLVIDPNFTSDNYLLLYDRVDVDGVLNAKGNLNVAGEYTANGIVSVKSGLNIVNRKSGLPITHFDFFGDGANYISGTTNFRNGDVNLTNANKLCIGSTCLTEDDFKKVKNNDFPVLNTRSDLTFNNGGKNTYIIHNPHDDRKSLFVARSSTDNTFSPTWEWGRGRLLVGERTFGDNIWVTANGYLHNNTTFNEKNGFYSPNF